MNPINELYTISMLAVATLLFAWRIGFFQQPFAEHSLPQPSVGTVLMALAIYLGVQLAFIPILAVVALAFWSGDGGVMELLKKSSVQDWINFAAAASTAPALVGYAWYKNIRLWQARPLSLKQGTIEWLKGIVTWIVAFPIVSACGLLVKLIVRSNYQEQDLEQVAVRHLKNSMQSPGTFLFAVVAIVVLIPITEELLFRGFVQNWLRRYFSFWSAIILASVFFASVHFAPSQGLVNCELLTALFILSGFLGYLYERQKTLWAPIGLHMLFNAVTVLMIALEIV